MRMTRKRSKRLQKLREEMEPVLPAFPYAMRMTRRRAKRLRELRKAEELSPPAFPRAMRMDRRRARRLRKFRLSEKLRLPAFPHVTRMTRKRKRQMKEREEFSHELTQTAAASLSTIYILHVTPLHNSHASPINTFTEVSTYFDYMKDARDRIKGHKKAEKKLEQAREEKLQADQDVEAARAGVRQLEEDLRAVEEQLSAVDLQKTSNRIAMQRAKDASAMRSQMASASQEDIVDFLPKVYAQRDETARLTLEAAQREAEYLSYRESVTAQASKEDAAVSRSVEGMDAQNRPKDAHVMAEEQMAKPPSNAVGESAERMESNLAYYESRMASANQAAEDARALLDELEGHLGVLQDRQSQAQAAVADARQEIIEMEQDRDQLELDGEQAEADIEEAQKLLADARLWLQDAEQIAEQANLEFIQAEYELEHFGEGHSYGMGMEYYAWQGNNDKESGHQLYTPVTVSGVEDGWDWALETGYVKSSSGKEKGDVSTWTATEISASIHNDHPINDVRYKMTVSAPMGQSVVHENANLPDELARYDSFNQGWNLTPEVDVVHHITERETITGRMSWTWRGDYDFRWDVDGMDRKDTASPGNLWKQEVEYLYAGKHYQFLGLFSHQSGASSRLGDYSYKDGDEYIWKGFYSEDVTPKDSYQAYAVIGYQAGAKGWGADSNGIWRKYYGLGWTHKIQKGQSWWVRANYMRAKGGAAYDYSTGQPTNNRRRWSLQLGYDHWLDEDSRMQLKLEGYFMKDEAAGNYHGWNASAMYCRAF